MNTQSSTIVQRLWNYCNVLRDKRRLPVMRVVPYGDDIESTVKAMLRSTFEGRLR